MSRTRAHILSIGGFDPSGGAGILADVKTFEQHRLLGMAVNTANTIQTEDTFKSVNWVDDSLILEQLETLANQYDFKFAKVGLIPNFGMIFEIKKVLPETKIIWDPVLSASAGFEMNHSLDLLDEILNKVHFMTPNWNEAKSLTGLEDGLKAGEQLAKKCNIYLKGGHRPDKVGADTIFFKGRSFNLKAKGTKPSEKHGSGCVLSSALAANLQHGFHIKKACLRAKSYVTSVLESNETLLGYHK